MQEVQLNLAPILGMSVHTVFCTKGAMKEINMVYRKLSGALCSSSASTHHLNIGGIFNAALLIQGRDFIALNRWTSKHPGKNLS